MPPLSWNAKELRYFLGHAKFYNFFIKVFSHIAKPLIEILQKDMEFFFNEWYLQAFNALKLALMSASIV